MSLKIIEAAMKQGGFEHPYELQVCLRHNPTKFRGGAHMEEGLLVLTECCQDRREDLATYIDPQDVISVTLITK